MRKKFKRTSDFHSHLRSMAELGKALFERVVELNTRGYKYVVAEPNTYLDPAEPEHHIETAHDLDQYRNQVLAVKSSKNTCDIRFLAKLTRKTTRTIVRDVLSTGGLGFKLYPEGVTNNSENGVSDFDNPQLDECLGELQKLGGILQEHPEAPGEFCMRREHRYGDVIRKHASRFPGLRIFVEHVTDRRTLSLLDEFANVFITITGHHKRYTLDDVLGQDDKFCRPNAKEPEDRDALIRAAMSGHPRIISITDSAFHTLFRKLLLQCACAGVFNPGYIQRAWLVHLFAQHNALDKLDLFAAENGPRAYKLPEPGENDLVEFEETDWYVPEFIGTFRNLGQTVVPFLAGDKLTHKEIA